MDVFDQISERQSEIDKLEKRIYDLEMVVTHFIDIVNDLTLMNDDREYFDNTKETREDLMKLQKEWGKYK